jgi:hypothetical protein
VQLTHQQASVGDWTGSVIFSGIFVAPFVGASAIWRGRLPDCGKSGHEGRMTDLEILRRYVAGRQLETGFEFNAMPGSRGVSLDPGDPARRSRAELEAIVAGRPTETEIPAGGETEIREAVSAAGGETISVETISGPEAETIIEPSRETIISGRRGRPRRGAEGETISADRPWVASGVSRASWYRRRRRADQPVASK